MNDIFIHMICNWLKDSLLRIFFSLSLQFEETKIIIIDTKAASEAHTAILLVINQSFVDEI